MLAGFAGFHSHFPFGGSGIGIQCVGGSVYSASAILAAPSCNQPAIIIQAGLAASVSSIAFRVCRFFPAENDVIRFVFAGL